MVGCQMRGKKLIGKTAMAQRFLCHRLSKGWPAGCNIGWIGV
ncbi:MAG: hypothetical protein SO013_04060 [Prevotella sp.]|nr:hypothetical protein [Prevotella sp.]